MKKKHRLPHGRDSVAERLIPNRDREGVGAVVFHSDR
jgi:hypothetical protein